MLQLLIALSLKGSTSQKNDNMKFKNLSLKKCNKLRTPNHSCSQSEDSCKIQFLYSPLKVHIAHTKKNISVIYYLVPEQGSQTILHREL